MSLINEIRKKINKDEFEFSKHAVDQSIIRGITVQEVREAILRDSELIEDYPDDKYGPSCLIAPGSIPRSLLRTFNFEIWKLKCLGACPEDLYFWVLPKGANHYIFNAAIHHDRL